MTELVIVPHTHWDREWYLPFQRFRLRLVTVMDALLKQLADDPRLRFTLDGQTAALDDYLEIRPEQDGLIRELVQQGQLAVGPWRVLADSFLCSGENLLRNLEIGMRRAADLGAVMRVGYLPDQFGHCAQLPQILRLSGIEDACVWRGVGSDVETTAFRWLAPDGTSVRTQYLPEGGYGGAAGIFADPDPAVVEQRAVEHARALRRWQKTGPLLGMYGTDHSAPVEDLADIVAAASRLAAWEDTVHPTETSAADTRREDLVDLLLNRLGVAEPGPDPADASPRARLRLDTLTGYFATIRAREPHTELVEVHGELRSHGRANLLPGVLSARVALKQALTHAERLVERYAEPLTALYGLPFATQPFLSLAWLRLVDSSCHDSVTGCGVDATAEQVAARIAEAADLAEGVCELVLSPIAGTIPAGGHLVFNPSPRTRTEVVFLDQVATLVECGALALAAVTPKTAADAAEAAADAADAPDAAEVQLTGDHDGILDLDNGLIHATLHPDGRLDLLAPDGTHATGLGQVVDDGDLGDEYNYAPPQGNPVITAPDEIRNDILWTGPLTGALRTVRRYSWPRRGDVDQDGRSAERSDIELTTRVELRHGEPFVRLAVSFDNRCDDHRVRLHFPLPRRASHSYAEGQFAVVERGLTAEGLTAEGGCGERPLPTFPARGWVAAGGLAVFLDHVSEYELVEDGAVLAITLLRSVGMLCRNRNAYRQQPAGPERETPGAQCHGLRKVELGLYLYPGQWHEGELLDAAERFHHPFRVEAGWNADPDSVPVIPEGGIEVTGAGVVLSSCRDAGRDAPELRLVALGPNPTTALVHSRHGDGEIALRPWQIVSITARDGKA